ncbi:hypothetical protein LQ318_05880 [Aliifodinibius salicampi]|uniref:Damage-inducible protein DinB n=1 Tax=Fodinibius salicampi TaxID=1920655 RepID=A0ABT3PX63_9BACT|nr:DinB family protein [Fodinibius salicampi]MCW9712431.1 hypothetical protein [Fodinibius salicampi]
MEYLNKQVHHCIWANEIWIEFLSDEGSNDQYLAKMMSHILLSEQAWFQRIFGQEIGQNIWQILPSEQLTDLQEEHRKIYYQLLEQDIDRVISFQRFSGDSGSSSIGDILLHLCTHGQHHRGQMSEYTSKREMDIADTDYISYSIHTEMNNI